MTVPYNDYYGSNFFNFKNLLKWKGSVYKLIWLDLAIFMSIHTILQLFYGLILPEYNKKDFQIMGSYFERNIRNVPLTFIFGFYVSQVIARFYQQFNTMPYPYSLAMVLNISFPDVDEKSLMYRRTMIRYSSAAYTHVLRNLSPQVFQRFPNQDYLVELKFLTKKEQDYLNSLGSFWHLYLFNWMISLASKARQENIIKSDILYMKLHSEINDSRSQSGFLARYEFFNLPLCYSQIVELARCIFLANCLFANLNYGDARRSGDYYLPLLTIVQVFIYTGWLKVATAALNPFGYDDDDFEVNSFIDQYFIDGMQCVDELFKIPLDLEKDIHWGKTDFNIPYTEIATKLESKEYIGSAAATSVTKDNQNIVQIELDKIPDIKIEMLEKPRKVSVFVTDSLIKISDEELDANNFRDKQSAYDDAEDGNGVFRSKTMLPDDLSCFDQFDQQSKPKKKKVPTAPLR